MRVATVAGVLSLTIAAASTTRGTPQEPTKPSISPIELLSWLPTDTETVVVTQTPATRRNGPLFGVLNLEQIHFGDSTSETTAKRQLRGFRVKASVEGSRHFRAPSGLGETRYEGATLFVLDRPIGSRSSAVMSELKKGSEGVISVEGIDVVQVREKLEDDVLTFYITIARPDIVIVATDREYLADVLRRRATREGPPALPTALPEWRWVDVNAPYWAIRHYRRDHVDDDPTSPFVHDAAAGEFDDGATGLTSYVTADGRTIVAQYLSTSGTAEAVANRMWKNPDEGVDATVRRAGNDVIEVRFTARDTDHLRRFFFFLFAALGHAIFV